MADPVATTNAGLDMWQSIAGGAGGTGGVVAVLYALYLTAQKIGLTLPGRTDLGPLQADIERLSRSVATLTPPPDPSGQIAALNDKVAALTEAFRRIEDAQARAREDHREHERVADEARTEARKAASAIPGREEYAAAALKEERRTLALEGVSVGLKALTDEVRAGFRTISERIGALEAAIRKGG